jgi:hypothetical protein
MIFRLKISVESQSGFASAIKSLWDQQLDSHSSTGRLDFLFEEIEVESQQDLLRDWPKSE